jgi:hypothetical protein
MIIRFSIKKGIRCRNRGINFYFALSWVRILHIKFGEAFDAEKTVKVASA